MPLANRNSTDMGVYLGSSFGKAGKIMQSQQGAGRLIELSKLHGVWIIPGPVIQKRILAVVYMVFVSPSYCIKPAMASFWYSVNTGNGNIWGQNGIDVVNKFMIQYAINRKMKEIPESEFKLKADLVLLAMGFISPQQKILDLFNVEKDQRGNAKANTEGESSYATSKNKVFAAGDMRRGQSLVVWAIREGRQCARSVDEFLMGKTTLPR